MLNAMNAKCTDEQDDCFKIGSKEVDITLPIEVRPDTDMGEIEIHCCGEPRIECMNEPCENGLYIEIRQRAKIVIPVKFNVKAIAKDTSIKCKDDCR
jgi:hypothetical protein